MSDFFKSVSLNATNSILKKREAWLNEKKKILDRVTYKYSNDLFFQIHYASNDGKFTTTFSVDKQYFNVSAEYRNILGNESQMIQNWLTTFIRLVGFTWQLKEETHLQNQVVLITINW